VDAKEIVENTSNLEGKISCEGAIFGCNHKKEEEMTKLFYFKIHMK
jgi:hypothetical protein